MTVMEKERRMSRGRKGTTNCLKLGMKVRLEITMEKTFHKGETDPRIL